MLKQLYKIDELGYLQEIKIAEFDEQGNCIEAFESNIVKTDIPQGLYRAKWSGSEWVETMTETEYIASLPISVKEPTAAERLQALEEVMLMIL